MGNLLWMACALCSEEQMKHGSDLVGDSNSQHQAMRPPWATPSSFKSHLASAELMDTAAERKEEKPMDIIRHSTGSQGHCHTSACSSQKYSNQGEVQILASSGQVTGLLLSYSSGTQVRHLICSCNAQVSGEQPISENDTPNLEEYQGLPEIQTKARVSQISKRPKNLLCDLSPAYRHNPPWLA